jgi:N6-adenosine-specific RNA methylase IME4
MHADSIMWLWVPNYILVKGLHLPVLDVWGFQPINLLTWVKDRFGTGDTLRGQTEHCVFATRGKPAIDLPVPPWVLFAPMRANSQKPDEFIDLVERHCPAPRYAYL